MAQELSDCVPRFGHAGCAARIYAQLLCQVVGRSVPFEPLEQRLAREYAQASIDFSGITVTQLETSAVEDYAPMLCPQNSQRIRGLFAPLRPRPAV